MVEVVVDPLIHQEPPPLVMVVMVDKVVVVPVDLVDQDQKMELLRLEILMVE
jgi:hypothetical protein